MPDHLIPDLYDDDWAGSLDNTPSVMDGESDPSDPNDRTPFGPPSPYDDRDQGVIEDDDPRHGDERPPLSDPTDPMDRTPFGPPSPSGGDDGGDKDTGGGKDPDYGKIIDAGIKGAIDAGKTAAEIAARERDADRRDQLEREKIQLQREALDRKERQLALDRAEREKRQAAAEQAAKERAEDKNWKDRTPDRRDTPPVRKDKDSYRTDLNDRVRAALEHQR